MRNAAVAMLALLTLVWASLDGSPASASSSPSSVASSFFGITVTTSVTKWPVTVPFGTLGKTAAGSTTVGTYWAALEPSNGTFNWSPMDDLIASAKAAGVSTVMYTFFETPQWASSNATQTCSATQNTGIYGCAAPPKNINDWDAFVTALATRYKGEIQYYELWNEPNVSTEFSGTVQDMVLLAEHAYGIINSIDPNATVLTPGVAVGGIEPYTPGCPSSQCWLAEYLQAGGGQYADGVAFHGKTCLSDNSLCTQEGIACSSTEIEACAGSSLVAQADDVRALMASYGLSGKPLVDTEGGYSDEVGQKDLWGTVDQQSAFVSRFFIVQASLGLDVAVWFSWLTNPSASLSGFGTTAAVSATDQAYQQTHDWLVGATFPLGPCSLLSGLWTCALTSSKGAQELLVWADTNSSASSYSPAGHFTEYRDLTGATHQISPGAAIPVNEKPILLESTPSSSSSSSSSVVTSSTSTSTTSTVPEFPTAIPLPATVFVCLAIASMIVKGKEAI